jgi:multicomponent Na+:H+ antiporter subunit C
MTDESHVIYLLAGVALFVIGFHGLISKPHLLKKILAANIMSSGPALVFIALAARAPGDVPDPIPHAMVLTGIVVAVCATGLALALADRVQAANGKAELDDTDLPESSKSADGKEGGA